LCAPARRALPSLLRLAVWSGFALAPATLMRSVGPR
jgi:hypothetical protein